MGIDLKHEKALDQKLGQDDPMLTEYEGRISKGIALPIDRANAAAKRADESYPMAAESESYERVTAERVRERVFRAARTTALAERAYARTRNPRAKALAERAANVAEGEALVLAAFDSANVGKDPLRREVAA